MKTPLPMLALAASAAPVAAHAAVIDFEAQVTPSTPTFVSPNTGPQTLTINGVTFTGGQLINATEDFFDLDLGDLSGTYMTFDYVTTLHTLNPIGFTFAAPVSSVSFDLVNNVAGTYQVTTNLGSQTFSLGDYANQTISLSGAAISSVAIRDITTRTVGPLFDFALDNISFATAAVPEPASWAMMIAGFGLVGGTMRSRRAAAAVEVTLHA